MSTGIKSQLIFELSEMLSENSAIESGRKARLLDLIFAHRLILGRMPDLDTELKNLAATQTTWREFLNSLLDSEEFAGRLDFLPAGLRLMSKVNDFSFWFDSLDREMGARMAAGIYEPETCSTVRKLVQPGMICLDICAQTGFYTCMMAQLLTAKYFGTTNIKVRVFDRGKLVGDDVISDFLSVIGLDEATDLDSTNMNENAALTIKQIKFLLALNKRPPTFKEAIEQKNVEVFKSAQRIREQAIRTLEKMESFSDSAKLSTILSI